MRAYRRALTHGSTQAHTHTHKTLCVSLCVCRTHRLDARVAIPPQGAHLFELRFAGWTQSAHFSTHTQIVKPGVLLPWRRPASAPAALTFDPPLPPQPQPPAAQSPLVAVVFAAFSIRSEKHLLFLAQQILRHM